MADFKINKDLYNKYCKQPDVLGGKPRLKLDKSLEMFELAKTCIPGGICGARKPMEFIYGEYPIFIERGKGSHVWDIDGNEYIDYLAGYGPVTIGWAIDEIDAEVKRTIDKGFCFSVSHADQVKLAKKLQEYIECAERVLFCKTGTDTTVAAVRMARAYTNKEKILTDGYHGWGDFSQYGEDNGVPESTKKDTIRIPTGDIEGYKNEIIKGNVAAVMITPYCVGPMRAAKVDTEFLRAMRELTLQYKIPLIFDEIRTAFRFAVGGIMEAVGVIPDIVCLAKPFANGYSISAVCGKAEIFNTLTIGGEKGGTFISSTYFPNNLEMVAALETIDFYIKHNVIDDIRRKGQYYMEGIDRITSKHKAPLVNYGVPEMPSYMFDISKMDEEILMARTMTLFTYIIRSGIFINPFRQQYITYSHTIDDIDKALTALDEGLSVVNELYPW